MAAPALAPLPAVARGHPQGEAAPARRRDRAAVPGEVGLRRRGLEPPVRRHDVGAALRFRGREPDARAAARASSRTRTRRSARRRRTRSPRRSGRTCALFTLITNTLAKDKEISDRWRKFADVADSRHLANRVEREVVEALVAAVTDAYPRLSHRYYALKARWFGKEKLAHWDRNAPLPDAPPRVYSWESARDTVLDAYAGFSPRMADIARRFFDEGWIDAPVQARQGARRLRPSDDALGAPLRAGQLPRQAARRDDARPRTRPRRASGAGRAERRADGADAADARRDGLGVRRDADLPRDARRARPTRPSARRCSPPRSRTCSTRSCARSPSTSSSARVHLERRNGELTAERINEFWLSVQSESLGPAIELKAGLRDLLGLYRPLHPFAVLRLRLRVRRLPGELALRRLRERARGLRRALSRDARGRRLEVLRRAAEALRPRRQRPGLLEHRAFA